jgi:D,D-heptose 1,7-bisphosphate phosphatase
MKVVIIAGGKGTRIASVAGDIPKAMIPVAGKPVAEYQVELAKRYGFTDILFLLGHLGEQIEAYFGDGSKWGVNIEYYHEREPLGTAGAFPLVAERLKEDFWVFYGDTVMDFDMPRMLEHHRNHNGVATLLLHPNDHPYDSDLVGVDQQGMVDRFYPKPHDQGANYRNLVNAALYILSPRVLEYIHGRSDFGKDIFPAMLGGGEKLTGYISTEYIKDMGTPERWESVADDVKSGKVARLNLQNPRPAFFLDRDGVICKEKNLLSDIAQVELVEGAAQAIRKINKAGYLAVVVTNQPVIARNLCSVEELEQIHNRLETLLGCEGAYLDAIYYCPHHPDGGYPEERPEYKIDCECRKPKPGMLLRAAKEWNIDMAGSYMVGDRQTDVEAGGAAGVRESFLIARDEPDGLLNIVNSILK